MTEQLGIMKCSFLVVICALKSHHGPTDYPGIKNALTFLVLLHALKIHHQTVIACIYIILIQIHADYLEPRLIFDTTKRLIIDILTYQTCLINFIAYSYINV